MNAHVPPPQMDDLETGDELVARQRRLLRRLAEIGMTIAEAMEEEAVARAAAAKAASARMVSGEAGGEAMPAPGPDLSLSFGRLTRAVRLTLAMDRRLADEQASVCEDRMSQARRARGDEGLRRMGRKLAVQAAVRDQIDIEAPESDVERLYEDLIDRIEAEAAEDEDFLDRPTSQVISFICKDMGLTPDWSLWEDEEWAVAEAEARAIGSPYAAMARQRAREERAEDAALWGGEYDPPKWPP